MTRLPKRCEWSICVVSTQKISWVNVSLARLSVSSWVLSFIPWMRRQFLWLILLKIILYILVWLLSYGIILFHIRQVLPYFLHLQLISLIPIFWPYDTFFRNRHGLSWSCCNLDDIGLFRHTFLPYFLSLRISTLMLNFYDVFSR